LNVANLEVSRAFYEKLGFAVTGGGIDQGYLILVNGTTVIGLFHGMFEKNILTFNPGIGQDTKPKESYTDVRQLQSTLEQRGIALIDRVDPDSHGPGHITLEDPDGNPILIDQFQ
jgi:catechol 2,3-dioxygenase-like lactoylglutathione lyase family enzyme